MEALQALDQKVEDSDHHQEDDFKSLQRNMRKLFGMHDNMRKNRANGEGSNNCPVCKQCEQHFKRGGFPITARKEFLDLVWSIQVM
uniref:Uncharacterized protein n=1 Tax=Setaria viridis TaxID=4556 RepID=A0A4U6VHP6_SETVI|nr:hypothetical protein SEVIR_3G375300v2 [Setaria viridis]